MSNEFSRTCSINRGFYTGIDISYDISIEYSNILLTIYAKDGTDCVSTKKTIKDKCDLSLIVSDIRNLERMLKTLKKELAELLGLSN